MGQSLGAMPLSDVGFTGGVKRKGFLYVFMHAACSFWDVVACSR